MACLTCTHSGWSVNINDSRELCKVGGCDLRELAVGILHCRCYGGRGYETMCEWERSVA